MANKLQIEASALLRGGPTGRHTKKLKLGDRDYYTTTPETLYNTANVQETHAPWWPRTLPGRLEQSSTTRLTLLLSQLNPQRPAFELIRDNTQETLRATPQQYLRSHLPMPAMWSWKSSSHGEVQHGRAVSGKPPRTTSCPLPHPVRVTRNGREEKRHNCESSCGSKQTCCAGMSGVVKEAERRTD